MTPTAPVATGRDGGLRPGGLFARIGTLLARHRAYRRTYRELNALSIDSLLDLDLYRGDLKRLAHDAVYNR